MSLCATKRQRTFLWDTLQFQSQWKANVAVAILIWFLMMKIWVDIHTKVLQQILKYIWNYFFIILHVNWIKFNEIILFEFPLALSGFRNSTHYFSRLFVTWIIPKWNKSHKCFLPPQAYLLVLVVKPIFSGKWSATRNHLDSFQCHDKPTFGHPNKSLFLWRREKISTSWRIKSSRKDACFEQFI